MITPERTTASILASFRERVSKREVIDPHEWMDACQMLIALQGVETDILFDLQQAVAIAKLGALEMGKSVAAARVFVEASKPFLDYQKQKAKIDQVIEFIRAAKLQARLNNDQMIHGQ